MSLALPSLFQVRRSSTWSVQQMPSASLSAGATPLTRMRCSLGTRWTSATSVLWSKDGPFHSYRSSLGPSGRVWERWEGDEELVAPEPTPSPNVLTWIWDTSPYQLRLRIAHQEKSNGNQTGDPSMVHLEVWEGVDKLHTGQCQLGGQLENRTLNPMTLEIVTGETGIVSYKSEWPGRNGIFFFHSNKC